MTPTISVTGLTRRYRDQLALDDITVDIDGHRITGLLGRNGAGKTTLMRIIADQEFAVGRQRHGVLGATRSRTTDPAPDGVRARGPELPRPQGPPRPARRVVDLSQLERRVGRELLRDFDLPAQPAIKKLSRGMRSALGIVIGTGRTGRGHALRRALRRPGRRCPAALLRPAARRLRRASDGPCPVNASHRRGRRPFGEGGGHRPRPDRARRRVRRRPRQRHDGERPARGGRGVRRRSPDLGSPPDRLAGVGRGRLQALDDSDRARAQDAAPAPGAVSLQQVVVHAAARSSEQAERRAHEAPTSTWSATTSSTGELPGPALGVLAFAFAVDMTIFALTPAGPGIARRRLGAPLLRVVRRSACRASPGPCRSGSPSASVGVPIISGPYCSASVSPPSYGLALTVGRRSNVPRAAGASVDFFRVPYLLERVVVSHLADARSSR